MGHLRASALGPVVASLALFLAAPQVRAADDPPKVNVNALRDPEMRNYRGVVPGLDTFDEHHDDAPAAPLRFQFTRPDRAAVTAADGLALKLVGDDGSMSIQIPVPRSQAAYDADAAFVLNKKNGQYKYHVDIRTPGLPDNVRRLGDLRLECRVTLAIGRDHFPFWLRVALTTVTLSTDWCGKAEISFPVPGKPVRVTLREGERKLPLKFDASNYMVPLKDVSFSNDALIEFEYEAQAADADTKAATP